MDFSKLNPYAIIDTPKQWLDFLKRMYEFFSMKQYAVFCEEITVGRNERIRFFINVDGTKQIPQKSEIVRINPIDMKVTIRMYYVAVVNCMGDYTNIQLYPDLDRYKYPESEIMYINSPWLIIEHYQEYMKKLFDYMGWEKSINNYWPLLINEQAKQYFNQSLPYASQLSELKAKIK